MRCDLVTVYGIPTCGTVKKARAWLDDKGVEHVFVDFRATPPAQERVERWVDALTAKALRNTSGKAYRALPEDKKSWPDTEWVRRFAADPMLIRRPVIEIDGAPVMTGFRKPEVLEEALS